MDKFRFDENIKPREVKVEKEPKYRKEKEKSAYPDFLYAGFFIRFLSFLVDLIVAGIISQILIKLISLFGINLSTRVSEFISKLIMLLYFTIMSYFNDGQTLGKMIFSLRVVQLDGEKLSFITVFIREFIGRFIHSFGVLSLLYIIVAFSDRKQSLSDIFADTSVVNVSKENAYHMGKEFVEEI